MPVSNRSARPSLMATSPSVVRVAAVAQVEQRRTVQAVRVLSGSRPGRQSRGAGSRWAMTSMAPNDSSAAASVGGSSAGSGSELEVVIGRAELGVTRRRAEVVGGDVEGQPLRDGDREQASTTTCWRHSRRKVATPTAARHGGPGRCAGRRRAAVGAMVSGAITVPRWREGIRDRLRAPYWSTMRPSRRNTTIDRPTTPASVRGRSRRRRPAPRSG